MAAGSLVCSQYRSKENQRLINPGRASSPSYSEVQTMNQETKLTMMGYILVTVAVFAIPAALSFLCYAMGV